MFGHVVNRKLASEDYKNIDLRKSQNLHLSKKNLNFFFSFFGKIGSEMLMGKLKFENFPFQYIKTSI